MPAIEDLLRREFKGVTDTVQPEQLRPLRVPAPRRRWRIRMIPVATAAAVIVIIVVAALLAGRPAAPTPPLPPADIPRYYPTINLAGPGLHAAVLHPATRH